MKHLKTHGILLHKYPIKENDLRATWYTSEYGRITTNIRGAKKITSKFSGNIDYLNLCTLDIYQSNQNYLLTECTAIHPFAQIKNNLSKTEESFEILKTIKKITDENQSIDQLFQLILEALTAIEAESNFHLIEASFKIKILNLLGLMPDLKECSHCHTSFSLEAPAHLSKSGSIICQQCIQHFPIEKKVPFNFLKLWHFLITEPIQSSKKIAITPQINSSFKDFINLCLAIHFHHSPNPDYHPQPV